MSLGARLLVPCLLLLLAWLPPETRGESMAGCALLVGLLALVGWRSPRAGGSAPCLLLAAIAVAVPLALVAPVPAAAVKPLAIGVLAVAAWLAAAWSIAGERSLRAASIALVIAAVGVAAFALYQKYWGLERWAAMLADLPAVPDREALLARLGRGRAFAAFATPAALGGFLVLTLPVTVGLGWSARGRGRWLAVVAGGAQAAALVASASATAIAALLGSLGVAALFWGRARRRLAVAAVALAAVLVGVAVLRGDRLLDPTAADSPWRLRVGNFQAAAAMAADHPWTGVGPGGFAEMYPVYRGPAGNETRHAHDLPLELAAEWGWPAGMALSALFFVAFMAPLWRERRADACRRGLAVGLAAFALQNLADFTAFMPSLLWTAALLCGALACRGTTPPVAARRERGAIFHVALVTIWGAVALAALGGFATNARVAARAAAFEGEYSRALRASERATLFAPWDVDAALLSARLTADVEQVGRTPPSPLAIERVERVVRLSPVRAAARELRARVRLASGDLPGAFADMQAAVDLHPAHAEYAAERDRLRAALGADGGDGQR